MLLVVFIGTLLGVAIAGLVMFGAMCAAINKDDRKGLPPQAPGPIASLTRWMVGLSGSRSAQSPNVSSQSELAGSAAGQPGQSWPEGR